MKKYPMTNVREQIAREFQFRKGTFSQEYFVYFKKK